MSAQNIEDSEKAAPQRFNIDLFIVHPTFDPVEISQALGLEGHYSHRVGDRRKTPKGQILSGTHPDTRWRHRIRFAVKNQRFAAEVDGFVKNLEEHKDFLTHIRTTGGQASVIIQFLGDGYFGDEIPPTTLTKLAELGLALAIECFVVPQN